MSPEDKQTTVVTSTETTGRSPKKGEGWRSNISSIIILLAAPLVALFLTIFVFQSYQVDGQSMETTLQNGDRLIVWKLGKSWSRITGHAYVPNRGDVVIFGPDKNDTTSRIPDKQLIKRVIALPGEHVTVQNNVVTVYNHEHPDGFQPDRTLAYGSVIGDNEDEQDYSVDLVVPDNEVFLMGDNRGNSLDSRSFGPVPVKNIVGKLAMRLLPIDKAKRF